MAKLDFTQLSPRHFEKGRGFDPAAFAAYKQAAAQHTAAAKWTYILWGGGLLLLILLQGIVGLAIFFGCMIAAMAVVMPKYKALKQSWDRLGISKSEANAGLINARKGIYAWEGEVAAYDPAPSSSAAAYTRPEQEAASAPAAHYPLKTVYLALYALGGLSVVLLLIDYLTGSALFLFPYVSKLVLAGYGVAVVLLLSDEGNQRKHGLMALAVGLLLQFFAANAFFPERLLHFYLPNMLAANSYILVEAAGVAALWWKREQFRELIGKQRLAQMALWYGAAAALMTLVYIIAYGVGAHYFAGADSYSTTRFLISNILYIFFNGAVVLGVYLIVRWLLQACHRPIRLGTGAKIWCWLCIVATTVSVVALFIRSAQYYGSTQGADPIAALIGVVGFILLLRHEKAGFMILLAALGTAFLTNAPNYLCYNFSYFVTSLSMLLNPLITWFIIRGAWKASTPTAMVYNAREYAAAAPVVGGSQPTSPLREAILTELAQREAADNGSYGTASPTVTDNQEANADHIE